MATAVKPRKGRRIVKGIEHGLGGYTNYGCRCETCTVANREHSQAYRDRRFAGNPLCAVPKCPHPQSRAYGNNLCYKHAQKGVAIRQKLERMSRNSLKRLIQQRNLRVRVLKRHTDDDVRSLVQVAILSGMK